MNDLDLLLFGNPSGVGLYDMGRGYGVGGGRGGKEAALVTPISPLELDGGGGVGSFGREFTGLDMLEMDFEFFQLGGSPVSPPSPHGADAVVGRKGLVGL